MRYEGCNTVDGVECDQFNAGEPRRRRVRWVSIRRLVPAAEDQDPRIIRSLAERIRESGRFEPITTMVHNRRHYIEDGHHRYQAAKLLGMKRVPVEVLVIRSRNPKAKRHLKAGY